MCHQQTFISSPSTSSYDEAYLWNTSPARQPHMDWFLWNPTTIFGEFRLQWPQWNVISIDQRLWWWWWWWRWWWLSWWWCWSCSIFPRVPGRWNPADRSPAILEPSWTLKQWKQNNRNSFAQKTAHCVACQSSSHRQLKAAAAKLGCATLMCWNRLGCAAKMC